MQKIKTKAEIERQSKRNQLIIGILLILLMMFSTLGYALSGKDDSTGTQKIDYKGIEFVKDSDYWFFNLQGSDFVVRHNPEEIENISFSGLLSLNDYSNQPLYFVGSGDAVFEIRRNLDRFVLRMQEACLPEQNCTGDLPIKNCSADNMIIVREPLEEELESIYQENNCVYIVSEYSNQSMYADAFLFDILGV